MTKPDPLSASALQEAEANLRNWLGTGGVFGESAEQFIVRHRDAVLSAEREQLLALTPEEVVEAAAKAMWDSRGLVLDNVPGTVGPMWLGADSFRDLVRAALPVLLGPEVARREQAERELADFKADVLKHTGDPLAASLAYEAGMRDEKAESWELVDKMSAAKLAAEAEAKRLRGALEELARPKRSPIDHEHALQCIAAIRRRARAALGGSNG